MTAPVPPATGTRPDPDPVEPGTPAPAARRGPRVLTADGATPFTARDAQVRARPETLRAFAEHTVDADLHVRTALDAAREVVHRYLAETEDAFVEDPTAVLHEVDGHLEDRAATAAAIGELARAFAALDGRAGRGGRVPLAPVQVSEWALAAMLQRVVAPPEDLTASLLRHDETRWRQLLYGSVLPPDTCQLDGRYRGGGFLVGPDGDAYPLVVPEVVVDGLPRNAVGATLTWDEVESLRGTDDGWVDVARRTGTTRFGARPSLVLTILASLAATNPNLLPTTRPIPREAVDAVGFGARGLTGGVPAGGVGPGGPPVAPPSTNGPPAPPPTGGPPAAPLPPQVLDGLTPHRDPRRLHQARADAVGHAPVGAHDRRPAGSPHAHGRGAPGVGDRPRQHREDRRAGGPRWGGAPGGAGQGTGGARAPGAGLDAIVTLGESLSLASSMRDHGLAHVDVRFQRAPDGRRRAIARSITGRTGARGTVLLPAYLTADETGRLEPVGMEADPHPTVSDPEETLLVQWGRPRDADGQ